MLKPAIFRAFYTALLFIANLALANILLPAYFGTISLLIINASIFNLVSSLGSETIVMHSVSSRKWNFSQGFTFMWGSIIFQLLLFILMELLYIQFFNKTLLAQLPSHLFFIELFYFTGFVLAEKYVVLLYLQNKALTANIALSIQALLYCALLLYIKNYFPLNYNFVFTIFALQTLVQAFILIIVFHAIKGIKKVQSVHWSQLTHTFKLSMLVIFSSIILLIANRVDFWFIKKFYSTFEVGVYAQANKFANLLWIVPNIFALLLIPKFGQLNKHQLSTVIAFAFVVNSILLVITIVTTQVFYSYFLRPEYYTGLDAFYLMLPGYFSWSIFIYIGAYFSWVGRFDYDLIIAAFCFTIIFICDALLIPKFSLNGAAISNSIAYTLTFILSLYFFYKSTSIKTSSLFRFQKKELHSLFKALK
jgi:O-antigen/teichoic acid export membrane protein